MRMLHRVGKAVSREIILRSPLDFRVSSPFEMGEWIAPKKGHARAMRGSCRVEFAYM